MQHVLSLSYGKDSLACIGAIEQLHLPLDRIVHAEVWATDTIPADLPPMVEFKKKADKIIKARWGIEVEHFVAYGTNGKMLTYENTFYREISTSRSLIRAKKYCWKDREEITSTIYGFPSVRCAWCNSLLKMGAINRAKKSAKDTVSYVGIAEDEPERLARLDGITAISPLHLIGWTEADAKQWCIDNDLLSPLYETADRGGCWFCHNQGVNQLRLLRKTYPELWTLLLNWDKDSPISFRADGHTVMDFERRFEMEDSGEIEPCMKWRWKYLESPPNIQIGLFNNEIWGE